MSGRWSFWIDRGGTFTDCLGLDPSSGTLFRAKLLSSDRAPLLAIRSILGLGPEDPIPPSDVRMGTTVATNALLERKGAPLALCISKGLGDALEIGTQARPKIFDLHIQKPELLYRRVIEVDARIGPDGRILLAPDLEALKRDLLAARAQGIEGLAVVVMHAYANPALENLIGRLAVEVGFSQVSLSHQIDAEIGFVARGDTTTVDAYLTPLVRAYLGRLSAELAGSRLLVMQSSGGLCEAASLCGFNAILSGPAAGVVAVQKIAERAQIPKIIGLDMGGTSTDVSRFSGEIDRVYETQIAGVRLRTPMLAVETIAAGGGSLCRFDGFRLSVGPQSAGAEPGPLCYGHWASNELTLTDVNLFLGRLVQDRFPFPLTLAPVEAKLAQIQEALALAGHHKSKEEIAQGFFEIANAHMAEAIRRVSVDKGHDVREFALFVFGGAAGQHACALARRLGMRRIYVHRFSGALSAYGMGLADLSAHKERDAGRILLSDQGLAALEPSFLDLVAEAKDALSGLEPGSARVVRRIDLRYRGTETALTLDARGSSESLARMFAEEHRRLFGYDREELPIEIVTLRAEAIAPAPKTAELEAVSGAKSSGPLRLGSLICGGQSRDQVPIHLFEQLSFGAEIDGPALILEAASTLVVDPGFCAKVEPDGLLLLEDRDPQAVEVGVGTKLDPIQLDIMSHLFMSIAEQMGVVLRRTAISTNIRERLDFSCAVLDSDANLVANAPHIPVHLGALSEAVRGILRVHSDPRPGDVFVTNDPAAGGSHLPDITVVTPVFDPGGSLLFFTASRGHHSDVGGITPGSMPPFSKTLEEEGVVLRALRVVSQGKIDRALIRDAFGSGAHPARDPDQNLKDLEAQIAANQTGARLLLELTARSQKEVVLAYMGHVQKNAAAKVRLALSRLPREELRFADALDDGTTIAVTLSFEHGRLKVDFFGTGAEQEGNLNAPQAVSTAAVIYVLRCLVDEPIPLNSGCLEPVDIYLPPGSILCPAAERAVCGGNVETSQRVVDVLLGALGKAAASQGTMNNFTFGNDRFGYYETIAGGAGAMFGVVGASAVHTHMTNTRITDPEVLETRFPVQLLRFSVRRRSGGRGRWAGGDGVIREIRFLEPMEVSILSERRSSGPFGLSGGEPGAPGRNFHNQRALPGKASFSVRAGDIVRIETPGGGGFGLPTLEDS